MNLNQRTLGDYCIDHDITEPVGGRDWERITVVDRKLIFDLWLIFDLCRVRRLRAAARRSGSLRRLPESSGKLPVPPSFPLIIWQEFPSFLSASKHAPNTLYFLIRLDSGPNELEPQQKLTLE